MGSISTPAETIFRSKLPDMLHIPDHLPLHRYCLHHAASSSASSSNPCIINAATGEVYSFSDVEAISRRVASGLRRLGVVQHDVIMLLLPNSPEFAFSFLAASMLGATSTTANPAYTASEVRKQAIAAGAKIVITEPVSLPKVENLPGVKIVLVGTPDEVKKVEGSGHVSFSDLQKEKDSREVYEEEEPDISPDDVVALPYSSGTTGLPKGVMLTHRGLVTSVAQQVDGENPNLWFRTDDIVLCLLPLFHIYSLNSVLLCGLRAGAAIVMMRKFEMSSMAAAVEKYKVTVAPIVPPIIVDLVKNPVVDKYDLSSIRMVMSGAAPMGKELEDKFRDKLPQAILGQGYGMTEAGPVLAMCLAFAKDPFPIKSGACGTVVRNAQLKIINPDTGVSLPRNQSGEICIRGSQIMKGYLNNPSATVETIDKEGWLHTGDIGFVDDDDEIFIVDRLKEIIKYNGFQVPPAELEALLIAHPAITDAAVVPMKVERSGEVPVAFVKLAQGSELSEEAIKHFISKQVVFYKRIHKVFFTDFIPKNPSGKILRKELRARLTAAITN